MDLVSGSFEIYGLSHFRLFLGPPPLYESFKVFAGWSTLTSPTLHLDIGVGTSLFTLSRCMMVLLSLTLASLNIINHII